MKKTIHVTGCTSGLNPEEVMKKFESIVEEIAPLQPKALTSVDLIVIDKSLNYSYKIDARMKAIANADIIVLTNDYEKSVESKLEFNEATRLNKSIIIHSPKTLKNIERLIEAEEPAICS